MSMISVGFEKLTIRVKDGSPVTKGDNLFVIEGKTDEGGTSSAKISGLAADLVKTWASNKVYKISGKGVGDAKIDFDIIDIPDDVMAIILGYDVDSNKIITANSSTEAPECTILIEDTDARGEKFMLGFLSGKFSYDGAELSSAKGKAEELKPDALSFSVGSADNGDFFKKYSGADAAAQAALRTALDVVVTP